MLTVQKEHIISLRYTMKDDQGVLLEDRMSGRPVEFLYGSGEILPELEANLSGMVPGDVANLSFSTELGNSLVSYFFEVVVEDVRKATESEIVNGRPEGAKENTDCGPECECW
ncbi:MAG: FKBP-type peptidyl-prolyl cis-trans isomerase [Imperialibacter sp.]|uniref:FKBP-type peptidyl-prolyl cis-trans isomerase n=1 Tax=Imperialibacter sp. TaxID=2038411 RepID=UPI0032ED29A9